MTTPPVTTPTIPLPGFPRARAAATGGVVLASIGAGTVRSRTDLPVQNDATADVRGVRAETIGTVQDTAAPALTFFGGEVRVRIMGKRSTLTHPPKVVVQGGCAASTGRRIHPRSGMRGATTR